MDNDINRDHNTSIVQFLYFLQNYRINLTLTYIVRTDTDIIPREMKNNRPNGRRHCGRYNKRWNEIVIVM